MSHTTLATTRNQFK